MFFATILDLNQMHCGMCNARKNVQTVIIMGIWVVPNSREGYKIRQTLNPKRPHFKEKIIFQEMDKH